MCPGPRLLEVRFTTPGSSAIPGDERGVAYANVPRQGGLLIADLSLANEVGPPCTPKS